MIRIWLELLIEIRRWRDWGQSNLVVKQLQNIRTWARAAQERRLITGKHVKLVDPFSLPIGRRLIWPRVRQPEASNYTSKFHIANTSRMEGVGTNSGSQSARQLFGVTIFIAIAKVIPYIYFFLIFFLFIPSVQENFSQDKFSNYASCRNDHMVS